MVTVLMVLGGWLLLSCLAGALVCAVASAEKAALDRPAPGGRAGSPLDLEVGAA